MSDEAEKTKGLEAAMAAARRVQAQGDPMRLQAPKRERRRENDRRLSFTRDVGGSLPYLHRKGTIDDRQLQAGLKLRALALAASGGMPARDWLRERVDGGPASRGPVFGSAAALDADRELKRVLRESGMGYDAAEVVLRVCCIDETLTSVACDFETDEQGVRLGARSNGACDRMTRAQVKGYLQSGLTCAYRMLWPANQIAERPARAALRHWMADDAATSDRPDIRASDPRFASGA